MTINIKNMLDYAHFNITDYQPSRYRNVLIDTANTVYKMYLNNNIQLNNESLPNPKTVKEVFNKIIFNYLKDAPYNDVNYITILDDLMLFVDENNIKLISE